MLWNLNNLEEHVSSQFVFEKDGKLLLKKHRKYFDDRNVGYLAKCAYKHGVLDMIEEIEDIKDINVLKEFIKEIKKVYSK